jgi:hypothetical protein
MYLFKHPYISIHTVACTLYLEVQLEGMYTFLHSSSLNVKLAGVEIYAFSKFHCADRKSEIKVR